MDTRYLRKRGQTWQLDFVFPTRVGGDLAGRRCRMSLETADYKTARAFRDKYVVPMLREGRERDLLETLAADIAKTNRRLRDAVEEFLAQTPAGVRVDDLPGSDSSDTAGPSIRNLADMYLKYLRTATTLAPASIRKYGATFRALCSILGDEASGEAIRTEHIVAFRDALLQMPVGWQKRATPRKPDDGPVRTVSPSSVNRDLQRIRTWFRWAIDEGKLRRKDIPGEKVKCKSVGPKQKECPTVEQADELLALPCPNNRDAHSWTYLPLFARYTGCRVGEIAGLTAEDVVTDHGVRCLRIHGTVDRRLKTAASERLVPVADKLAPHLDEVTRLHPAGRLFPDCGDWTGKDGVVKLAHYHLKSWNVAAKHVGPFSFHCWRVYANNEMVRGDVDIIDRERILGHASTRTQAAYTSPELKRYQAAVNKIR